MTKAPMGTRSARNDILWRLCLEGGVYETVGHSIVDRARSKEGSA